MNDKTDTLNIGDIYNFSNITFFTPSVPVYSTGELNDTFFISKRIFDKNQYAILLNDEFYIIAFNKENDRIVSKTRTFKTLQNALCCQKELETKQEQVLQTDSNGIATQLRLPAISVPLVKVFVVDVVGFVVYHELELVSTDV